VRYTTPVVAQQGIALSLLEGYHDRVSPARGHLAALPADFNKEWNAPPLPFGSLATTPSSPDAVRLEV
jgi:hypothetical protein